MVPPTAAYSGDVFLNKIVVDIERCKGCYLCVEACPQQMIAVGEKLNSGGHYPACPTVDGQCKACALCAHVCPDAAIEVYREVREE